MNDTWLEVDKICRTIGGAAAKLQEATVLVNGALTKAQRVRQQLTPPPPTSTLPSLQQDAWMSKPDDTVEPIPPEVLEQWVHRIGKGRQYGNDPMTATEFYGTVGHYAKINPACNDRWRIYLLKMSKREIDAIRAGSPTISATNLLNKIKKEMNVSA